MLQRFVRASPRVVDGGASSVAGVQYHQAWRFLSLQRSSQISAGDRIEPTGGILQLQHTTGPRITRSAVGHNVQHMKILLQSGG